MSPIPDARDRILAWWWRRHFRGYITLRRLLKGGSLHREIRCPSRYGSRFLLDPANYIDGRVVAEGYYESEVIDALVPSLGPDAVFWDVGANFGLHAVTAAHLAPLATVVAFEPNPREHTRLLRHRDWNATRLVTSTVALSNAAGIVPLHLGPEGNTGMSALAPRSQAHDTGIVLVMTAKGDELVSQGQVPAPTCLKIDVEGHEAAVCEGLAQSLAHPRCRLVVFEDGASAQSPVKQRLKDAGFTIEPLVRREDTAHPLLNFSARKPA